MRASARSAKTSPIGTSRLTERQMELLGSVEVKDNVAVFARDEIIPDWKALKAVMVALGGQWKSRVGFRFPDEMDAAELVRLARETGEILDPRKADYFPTPAWLAEELVQKAGIEPGHRVLEPSAGRGAIAEAVRRLCPPAMISCVETLPQNVACLLALRHTVMEGDFLTMGPQALGRFDRVVMNPPFSARADIAHVRHAHSFLCPGGRLAAIMSSGVSFREDRFAREFREFVMANGGDISPNPDGAFLESGTGVRTVTVLLERGPRG